jgi:deoxyribodipyrimidine photolyase-like uncharacterized protein
MTPSQIITQEVQTVGGDADVLLRKIDKLVDSKAAVILQKNDTVLLLIAITKTTAEAHVFTVDKSGKLKAAMEDFAKKLKSSKINTIYGSVEKNYNPVLEQAFDFLAAAGLNIQESNLPEYSWMATLKGAK